MLLGVTIVVSAIEIGLTRNGSVEHAGYASSLGVLPDNIRPLTYLSYNFVHADVGHLLVNLFYLWVFGAGVEAAIGKLRFLAIYVLGGMIGAMLQTLVALKAPDLVHPGMPIIGASAGCSCLIGVYAVRYYRDRISFVGIPYQPNVVEVVTLFLCLEISIGMWELFIGLGADGVAHWAHIGGFVFGLTCAYLMHLDSSAHTAYMSEDAVKAMEKSRPGAAVARIEHILALDPNNAAAHGDLARAWIAFGDKEQAFRRYTQAIHLYSEQDRRRDAAQLYQEMRRSLPPINCDEMPATPPAWTSTLTLELSPSEFFAIGLALEEIDDVELAAEALRTVTLRAPDSTEAETALVKVARIYIDRLGRSEEARILLRLFIERYPGSALLARAEEMRRGFS
jgi:membrane associated rhomboid family serine protease